MAFSFPLQLGAMGDSDEEMQLINDVVLLDSQLKQAGCPCDEKLYVQRALHLCVRSTTSRLNAVSNSSITLLRSLSATGVDQTMCVGSFHSVSKRQAPLRASCGITRPCQDFVDKIVRFCRNDDMNHEMLKVEDSRRAEEPLRSQIRIAHTVTSL
jgi:hypothetical protein